MLDRVCAGLMLVLGYVTYYGGIIGCSLILLGVFIFIGNFLGALM